MIPYVYNTSFKTNTIGSASNGAAGLEFLPGTVKKVENVLGPITNQTGSNSVMFNKWDGGVVNMREEKLHDTLDPRIWESEDKLKPIVRDKLLAIANMFKEDLGLYITEDIRITGSEANYNYNPNSDIDLHLVYDFSKLNIDPELLSSYFYAQKTIFNNEYNFMIKKIPVEVGVEDVKSTLVATGVYSLIEDKWIKKPSDAGIEVPDPDTTELNYFIQKIETAIESKDIDTIKQIWSEIRKLRKDSLAQGGEFSSGNLIFKQLRNGKYIERLKDALNDAVSQQLSLENRK